MTETTESTAQPFSVVLGELVLAVWRRKFIVIAGVLLSGLAGFVWASRGEPVYEAHATVAAWLNAVPGSPKTSASIEVLSTAVRGGLMLSKALDSVPDARARGLSAASIAASMTFKAEPATDVRSVTLRAPDPDLAVRFLDQLLAIVAATPGGPLPPATAGPSPNEQQQIDAIYERMAAAERAWLDYQPPALVAGGRVSAELAQLRQVDIDLAQVTATLRMLQLAEARETVPGRDVLRADLEHARSQIAGLKARRAELEFGVAPRNPVANADHDPAALRARYEGLRALYQEMTTSAQRTLVSLPAASRLRVAVVDHATTLPVVKISPRPWRTAWMAAGAGLLVLIFCALVANSIEEIARTWPPRSA